jgi:hypothetical protein
MNRNSTSSVGALHPILFFAIVYAISLFLAFFVCSTVYYTFNDPVEEMEQHSLAQQPLEMNATATATAFR